MGSEMCIRDRFPENHGLSAGVRGVHTAHFLHTSDLIMSIGSSLSPGRFSHAIPDAAEKKIIVCDINENNVNKIYHTDHALIGDARVTLQALIDELAKRTSGAGIGRDNIVSEILEERQKDELKYRDALNSSETPINPYRVYADIMKVIDPQKSFVTLSLIHI